MKHSVELVIARYKEDVSWLGEVGFPAIVYDKSGKIAEPAEQDAPLSSGNVLSGVPPFTTIPLPNIGRESHTYLHHILTRYPEFPDYTVFLQGSPFFHMDEGTTPAVLRVNLEALMQRNVHFKGLAYYNIRCDRLGRPHHLREPQHQGKWAGWGRDIPVGEIYPRLFAGPVPEVFNTRAPAGLFLVSRQRLLSRPLGLYRAAMNSVLADPDDAFNTGHAMERLWYLVFNGYGALNRDDYPDALIEPPGMSPEKETP